MCGEAVSKWFFLDLKPEGGASQYITGHFCTSGFGVRVQARDPAYQQKWGHTSSLVPSLKTFRDLPSSRVALDSHHSTKQSLLPVLSVCLFLKTCIYSTLDLNQGTGVEAESNRAGGCVAGTEVESQMCPGFLGAAPALRAPAPPTPLACTLIYLSSVGKQTLSLFFKKSHGLEGNWSSSKICFSIMDQTKWGGAGEKS